MADQESNKKLHSDRRELFINLRRSIRSHAVLKAMERVPREEFVLKSDRFKAYLNMPLSIGEGQTISQPYVVALMTEALELQPNDKVLEVGAGSGYQAAVLAELVPEGDVVTVELIKNLAARARQTLGGLGYKNVTVEDATESLGFPEGACYNVIVVSAATPTLCPSLIAQLGVGGRMVIPVGDHDQQELVYVLKTGEGISFHMLGPCRFVPLVGREAFPPSS